MGLFDRFKKGLSIREISESWDTTSVDLFREFAKAREEYRQILMEVVGFYQPGTAAEVEKECAALRELISKG